MIITGILWVIMGLISIILTPIDFLITSFLPSLSGMLENFSDLLTVIFSTIGWAISASGIPGAMISLIVTYYIFVLTIPSAVYLTKLVLRWYHYLKP